MTSSENAYRSDREGFSAQALWRPAYTIHEKFVAANQDFVITDENRQPVLFARRPVGYGKSFLALFAAIIMIPISGVIAVQLMVALENLRSVWISAIEIPILGIFMIWAICATYVYFNPRYRIDFYADKERSQLLFSIVHYMYSEPLFRTYLVSSPDGSEIGRWRKNLVGRFIRERWNAFDSTGANVVAGLAGSWLQLILGRLINPLGYRKVVFHEVKDGSLQPDPIGEFHRDQLTGGCWQLSDDSTESTDPRMILALGAILHAARN